MLVQVGFAQVGGEQGEVIAHRVIGAGEELLAGGVQQLAGFGLVHHLEARRHAGLGGEGLQQALAEGMDGLHAQAAGRFQRQREQAAGPRQALGGEIPLVQLVVDVVQQVAVIEVDPLGQALEQAAAHLRRGGAGVGDAEDVFRPCALQQQADDAVHQQVGLAGAGIGVDEHGNGRVGGLMLGGAGLSPGFLGPGLLHLLLGPWRQAGAAAGRGVLVHWHGCRDNTIRARLRVAKNARLTAGFIACTFFGEHLSFPLLFSLCTRETCMPQQPEKPDGGSAVARALAAQGIRHAFCVPGESYLPLLAALPEAGVEVITCRHEGTAAMAAEAMGRLNGGVPGLCLATRAPGAANAVAGAVVANLDATPLVIMAGQVARHQRQGQAFQEAALTEMFRPLCKHVEEVCDARALPAAVARACHVARAGTPGPVFLSLPEDVLAEEVDAPVPLEAAPPATPAPEPEAMRRLRALLEQSERPLLIAGGGPQAWTEQARARLHAMAEKVGVPLVSAFRRQGLVDAVHPACAGTLGFRTDPALLEALRQADLLILLGTRAVAITLDNLAAAFNVQAPLMPVVHVHPDAAACGRNVRAGLAICATPEAFLTALAEQELPPATEQRQAWMQQLHAAHLAWSGNPPPMPGRLDMGQVFLWLREHLPADAVITNGAGNYALWLHRFFHHRDLYGQLAPVAGSMGYGLPAALAAKLRFPAREVVAVAGDGCFQMNMQDFATAVQYGLGIIVLVVDNGQLGTIRSHQLRRFPGADCATALRNPDFAAFAEACGGWAAHVHETAAFADAFGQARAAARKGQPALLHLHVSPQAIAPGVDAPEEGEAP